MNNHQGPTNRTYGLTMSKGPSDGGACTKFSLPSEAQHSFHVTVLAWRRSLFSGSAQWLLFVKIRPTWYFSFAKPWRNSPKLSNRQWRGKQSKQKDKQSKSEIHKRPTKWSNQHTKQKLVEIKPWKSIPGFPSPVSVPSDFPLHRLLLHFHVKPHVLLLCQRHNRFLFCFAVVHQVSFLDALCKIT